ncbi:MAG: Transposase, IS4 family protein [Leptospirillum sp. Group IV 'UBA BS']|nr:MAG: Transposase, IS4 family protein [Leptospirillum sp. Group IV 'UBA BS']
MCRNPFLAHRRAWKREQLHLATEKDLEKIAEATRRAKNLLRGQDKTGLRAGKWIDRHHMGKHFELTITETAFPGKETIAAPGSDSCNDSLCSRGNSRCIRERPIQYLTRDVILWIVEIDNRYRINFAHLR